jgi:hypothetical protein
LALNWWTAATPIARYGVEFDDFILWIADLKRRGVRQINPPRSVAEMLRASKMTHAGRELIV